MPFLVAFTTLGCKTNHYDSAAVAGRLDPHVFETVPFEASADAYVIFSCAVTAVAERQSRQFVYRARRTNPQARVALAGCAATLSALEARAVQEGVEVLPRGQDPDVLSWLMQAAREAGYLPQPLPPLGAAAAQTRPYLKVEDGCAGTCTYCVIPRVRGPVRSVPIPAVLDELAAFAARGFREIVLTGIHIGLWGRDLPGEPPVLDLLRAIDRHAPAGVRVRLGSLEPLELGDGLIELLAGSHVFCPHLHIPLQSGSDGVLARMNRPYRMAEYGARIERAAQRLPRLGLGTDIITGFPQETDAEAEETYAHLVALPFTYLHVFPYSVRPGTPAAAMPPVPVPVIKRRKAALVALGEQKRRVAGEAAVGKEWQVLLEERTEAGTWRGYTETYLPVEVAGMTEVAEPLVRVRAERFAAPVLIAAPVEG